MKLKSFLIGGLLLASFGIMAVGCNDNPTDNTPTGVAAPTGLKATSLSETSVKLAWVVPNATGISGYMVSWKATNGNASDTGSNTATATAATGANQEYTVSGLTAGQEYTFYVRTMVGTDLSSAVSVNWAGAARYTDGGARTLRMYEKASNTYGSGLLLDPNLGGPRMAFAKNEAGNVQLIWVYAPANGASGSYDTLIIGCPPAFPEYAQSADFYANTYISDPSFYGTSLDDIYPGASLDQLINTSSNANVFKFRVNETSGVGDGFYVRIGTAGNYHYARVFIRNYGGSLVQGSSPDRYLTLDVSYQNTANLPYAKPAGHGISPIGYHSGPMN
jgi:hypothetical protein